ncbi:MAG TPA: hypothetical protein VGK59_04975 [Ohtaekwangia sp.]
MTATFTIQDLVQQYADEIGGQFTDYDHTKSVLVIPIDDHRFQTVLAITQKSQVSGREQALFTSKVCEMNGNLDFKNLLEQHAKFDYSKFILEDGYLKVEASCLAETVSEEQVKEMIQEVAQLADHYELKLTGQDIH